MTPERLGAFRQTRQRWVLLFGSGQLLVLACGAITASVTGFFGFLALAAAWMFIATRISRYVLGNRGLDREIGQMARRRMLSGTLHQAAPAEVVVAVVSVEEHRRMMLYLPYGMATVLLFGSAGVVVPAAAPWLFGVAALAGIVSLGWAWSKRKEWGTARAWVDAWVEVSAPLEVEDTTEVQLGPQLTVLEGGRGDEE